MEKRFVSYCRVSTRGQERSGLGLEAQRQAVADYVAGNGNVLMAEYVETESGSRDDRPELLAAIAYAKKNDATLVIAKLDRLARDVHLISGLMKSGRARQRDGRHGRGFRGSSRS